MTLLHIKKLFFLNYFYKNYEKKQLFFEKQQPLLLLISL